MLCLFLGACADAAAASIERHPAPASWASRGALAGLPVHGPGPMDPFAVDLRGYDLSALDLRDSLPDLQLATFDNRTVWPAAERMPPEFYWQRIMELGRNPGLGIRSLHAQGLTGGGVRIAIIDQPLLVDHQEYADRLELYEEIHIQPKTEASMHGAAVASIAVGRSVGVAPGARLYYIGTWTGDFGIGSNDFTYNFAHYAQAVRRILAINSQLPSTSRIRVIALQASWHPEQRGYDEINAAVEEARQQGILVVSSSLEATFGLKFNGLGRDPMTDPDDFGSYAPGSSWAEDFYSGQLALDGLLVPMDARTTASPGGLDEYVFYRMGGWSWSIPYIAGVYALACQVDPAITPDRFWELAMRTGRIVQIEHEGRAFFLGPILDPASLIAALQED